MKANLLFLYFFLICAIKGNNLDLTSEHFVEVMLAYRSDFSNMVAQGKENQEKSNANIEKLLSRICNQRTIEDHFMKDLLQIREELQKAKNGILEIVNDNKEKLRSTSEIVKQQFNFTNSELEHIEEQKQNFSRRFGLHLGCYPGAKLSEMTNVALGKTASSLSMHVVHLTSNAIDGSYSTFYHTANLQIQWIAIDLGNYYTVGKIKITGRNYLDRLGNQKIYVSDTFNPIVNFAASYPLFYDIKGNAKSTSESYIGSTFMCGRYVIIHKTISGIQEMEEIEVWGARWN